MTMTLTLLFVAFGVPLLTTILISGYELLATAPNRQRDRVLPKRPAQHLPSRLV